jgi:hypothetical protein
MESLGFRFAYLGHGKTMDAGRKSRTREAPPASLCAANCVIVSEHANLQEAYLADRYECRYVD